MVFTLRVPKQPDGLIPPESGSLPDTALDSLTRQQFGLYFHVPFCTKRCGYCDFNTYTATELPGFSKADWPTAILAELALANSILDGLPKIDTIFIGGGTPSLIEPDIYVRVFNEIRNRFASNIEITMEANPDSVTLDSLQGYFEAGINRISFGMQSAAANVLKTLDRTHDPAAVEKAVSAATAAGFKNISLDLIYGTPGESESDWLDSLNQAIALPINHLSAYSLIVESGTKLANQVERGEVAKPDDDLAAARYLLAEDVLTQAGFNWYEISNWGKAGATCSHNQLYWNSENWWGVGPGAHSHIGSVRWWNAKHPGQWQAALAAGRSPAAGREVLTAAQVQLETVMLGLRQRRGLPLDRLPKPELTAELAELGWLQETELAAGQAVLSLTGRLMADRAAALLLQ